MPRPKGIPNKRSQMLLKKLENDHNFYVVKELVEIYQYDKQILVSLAAKVAQNLENNLSPHHEFTEEEAEMYNNANKNCQNVLIKLLSYCYPKLKAMEINTGVSDRVVFNINTNPDLKTEDSPPEQQEATVH